ncbi:hypothetical protein J7M00_00375, partial [bacterium]|nr:hypothetical protein [bacterium]
MEVSDYEIKRYEGIWKIPDLFEFPGTLEVGYNHIELSFYGGSQKMINPFSLNENLNEIPI